MKRSGINLNFEYDKIIIVKYDFGGGGRFLINCLGLSNDATFLCPRITKLQLLDKFTSEKKLKYLLVRLKKCRVTKTWDELGLIDKNFWGISDHDFFFRGEEDIINYNYPEHISKCIDNGKYIFISTHEDEYIQKLRNCWRNSKYIVFKNENVFKNARSSIIDGDHDYFKIKDKLNLSSLKNINDGYDFVWDSSWYLSKDITVQKVKELYDHFHISGFDAMMISKYYDAWIDTIF